MTREADGDCGVATVASARSDKGICVGKRTPSARQTAALAAALVLALVTSACTSYQAVATSPTKTGEPVYLTYSWSFLIFGGSGVYACERSGPNGFQCTDLNIREDQGRPRSRNLEVPPADDGE